MGAPKTEIELRCEGGENVLALILDPGVRAIGAPGSLTRRAYDLGVELAELRAFKRKAATPAKPGQFACPECGALLVGITHDGEIQTIMCAPEHVVRWVDGSVGVYGPPGEFAFFDPEQARKEGLL